MCAYYKRRLHIPDNYWYWLRNYTEKRDLLFLKTVIAREIQVYNKAKFPRGILFINVKEHSVVGCS